MEEDDLTDPPEEEETEIEDPIESMWEDVPLKDNFDDELSTDEDLLSETLDVK